MDITSYGDGTRQASCDDGYVVYSYDKDNDLVGIESIEVNGDRRNGTATYMVDFLLSEYYGAGITNTTPMTNDGYGFFTAYASKKNVRTVFI